MPPRTAPVLLAALLGALPASANGRYPASQDVQLGPGARRDVVVLRVTFGFAASGDGGRSFHWICEDALGYGGTTFDPGFALDDQGRAFVGLPTGMVRASVDRCTVDPVPVAAGEFVRDLDGTPDGRVVVAATSPGPLDVPGRIYRSDDGAQSFRVMGDGVPGVAFETVAVAPSDASRLYLSGTQRHARPAPDAVALYRSDDGGHALAPLPVPPGIAAAWVSGIDPGHPEVVYVRADLPGVPNDAGGVAQATALLRSDDAGMSWREIARTAVPMTGFAVDDTGARLWIGTGTVAGTLPGALQRSDDGGRSWRSLPSPPVRCLRFHAGTLWVCSDDNQPGGFALGSSGDGGMSLVPVLHFRDLGGPFNCPPGAPESSLCGSRWPGQRMLLGQRDGVQPAPDAGVPHGTTAPGGCSCTVAARPPPGEGGSRPGVLAAALALSWWCGRRWRRGCARSRSC